VGLHDVRRPVPRFEEQTLKAPRFRVLLADDVANLRVLVRLALELHGPFEVVAEAENGAEAVERAREFGPDLVLLDVSMPVLDGIEALPAVRAAAPDAKVVVLSAFEERRLARTAIAAGAADYVEKGIEPRALAARLTKLMAG